LDGGQHDLPEERAYDEQRTAYLKARGLVVLRFWNSQIRENLPWVMVLIRRAAGVAMDYDEAPHPNPLPKGEREQT
jgi:very-short-patch-repair endonuclease